VSSIDANLDLAMNILQNLELESRDIIIDDTLNEEEIVVEEKENDDTNEEKTIPINGK